LSTTPDLIGPIHGFRDWRLTDEGLCSPRVGVVWNQRRMAAECRPQSVDDLVLGPHESPDPECHCGIRAAVQPSLERCKVDFRAVPGIVTVWGRLTVDRSGMRAQWAEIHALGVYDRWTRRQKAAVLAVADELDVDVVPIDDLETRALAYGAPLPEILVAGLPPAEAAGPAHQYDRRRAHTRQVVVGA